MSAQSSSIPAEQNVRLVLGAVATVLLLASLGQTIVSTALPTIVSDLGGVEHLTWVITAYLLASTVGAPIYGKLGDLYGRKIVLQSGILIFLAGSVVAGLAADMTMMVIGRALQGLGGGGLMVVAMTVVADVLPARERGKAQGLLGGVFGISTVIGPLIGGFLVEHLSWHWIFFVNLPVGLAAMVVMSFALRKPSTLMQHKIDYAGAALLGAALSAIVLIATLATDAGWTSPEIMALGAIVAASLVGFVLVERKAAEPILPLQLFRINNFVVTNAVGAIVGVAMFGSITFMPLYLQVVKGLSPTDSGLFLLPMMGGLLLASITSGRIMSATGKYRLMPILSTGVLAVGMLLMTSLAPDTEIWQVAIYMFVIGLGIGPVMSIGVTAIQNAVPVSMLGVGTSSVQMFRLIGGSVGTSIFGAIFASGLAANIAEKMPAAASTNMGSGGFSAQVVQSLPAPVQAIVFEAFTNALHPIFFIGAGLGVLACIISFFLKEIPLATTLQHPAGGAELEAEEEAAAAVVGAPAQ